jgi:hypothetical protein
MKKNKQFLIFGIVAIIFAVSFVLINFVISDKIEIRENDLQKLNPESVGVSSSYPIGSFKISTTIINGSINSITKLDDSNSILVEINSINQGDLTIKIPKTMLKAINDDYSKFFFFVLSDDEETNYEQIDPETIKINFQNNTKKIEIIGASRLN